jgi:hypothetical protein
VWKRAVWQPDLVRHSARALLAHAGRRPTGQATPVRPPFGGGGHYAPVFAVLGWQSSPEGPATKGAATNAGPARGRRRLAMSPTSVLPWLKVGGGELRRTAEIDGSSGT